VDQEYRYFPESWPPSFTLNTDTYLTFVTYMTLRTPNIYLRLQQVRIDHGLISVCEPPLIHDVYHARSNL